MSFDVPVAEEMASNSKNGDFSTCCGYFVYDGDLCECEELRNSESLDDE